MNPHKQTYEFDVSSDEFEAVCRFEATNETYEPSDESIDWDTLDVVSVRWYADARFEDVDTRLGDEMPETLRELVLEEVDQEGWPAEAYVA